MSVSVTVNNVNYTIPTENETGWADQVTSWIQAVSNSTLQKSGGTFTLTADVNFGASYGLKAAYFSSRSSNPATTGQFRLANADTGVVWRNAANSANLPLTVDSSNRLTFNGVPIASSSGIVPPSAGGTGIANNDSSTVTISGSYPLTLTLSASTGVTLPTTGTLATLAGTETLSNKVLVGASSNPADSGNIRLSNLDSIAFRNAANSDNVLISVRSDNSVKISGGVAAGSDQILFLQNGDNTNANSDAYMLIQSGGTSGGDAFINFSIPGGTSWSVGADNSAGDSFSITNGIPPGGASQMFNITTSGVVTIGASGGTVSHAINGNAALTGRLAVGTTVSGPIMINIEGSPSSGTAQWGVYSGATATSAATSGFYAYSAAMKTEAAAYTAGFRYGFYNENTALGAGSTVTRDIGFGGSQPSRGGTANAMIADNTAFSGNYFINQSGTNPSSFGGIVICTAGVRTKVSVADTSNPPTQAQLVGTFGTAATVGSGFIGIVNDNSGGTNEYLVWSDGTNYFYVTGTVAP